MLALAREAREAKAERDRLRDELEEINVRGERAEQGARDWLSRDMRCTQDRAREARVLVRDLLDVIGSERRLNEQGISAMDEEIRRLRRALAGTEGEEREDG